MGQVATVYYWYDYCCVVVPVDLTEVPEDQRTDAQILKLASQLAGFDNLDVSNKTCEIVHEKING
jgi:hypothetical protein